MTEEGLSPELVRDFVIAGHGDLARVKELLAQHPELLNAAQPWSEKDRETAIQAAAQVGNVGIAEYLLSNGAPLDICTAAMLGRTKDVERLLEKDSKKISSSGAHGIPLLTHAALSGNLELIQMLVERGAKDGMSAALHNAASGAHYDVARWLLENGNPDLSWKNFQGKTVLTAAIERQDRQMEKLLRERGATE